MPTTGATSTPSRIASSAESTGDSSSGHGSSSGQGASSGEGTLSGQGSQRNDGAARSSQTSSGSFRFVNDFGLLVPLGEGGMGEVWAARDVRAPKNRVVALKTTKQQGAEAARVLWDEARIASLIDHPNVCRVHDLGRDGPLQYLVMDYCDGASLHDLLQACPDKKLPILLAVRIAAEVAAGLHAAHELVDEEGNLLHVVHRDVSPQNILISMSGHVTVTDFGVARALGQAHKATETGEMKGKLSYMAPEQVTSRDFDRRADLFALGCVLYQATLGKRPFHGEDALATLYQLLEQPVKLPTEVSPDFPPELEKILTKALAKNRDERQATTDEFQRDLVSYLMETGQRVLEKDVGDFLMQHLGESLIARKNKIAARSEDLEKADLDRKSGALVAPLEASASVAESANSSGLREDTVSSTQRSVRVGPLRARRLPLLLLSAMLFLGGAFWLIQASDPASKPDAHQAQPSSLSEGELREEKLPQTEAPALVPPKELPEPESEVSEVVITITTIPESAILSIDGKKVGTGKYVSRAPSTTTGHLLRAEAPGYKTLDRAIVFDKTSDLRLELTPLTRAVRPPKIAPEPKAPPRRETTKKPPRTLDSDNPFATPP